MTTQIIMVLISILVAVAYLAVATWKDGALPDSISAMVYSFGKAGRWTWTLWLWTVTFLFTPALLDALEGNPFQFIGFFTVASLMFCGAMPLIAGEKNTLHYVTAIIGAVLSQVCVLMICPLVLLLWFSLVGLFFAKDAIQQLAGKGVLVMEILCWLTTMLALIIKL